MGNSSSIESSGGAANWKAEQDSTGEAIPQSLPPQTPSLQTQSLQTPSIAANFIFVGLIATAIVVLGLCILLAQSHSVLSVQASIIIGLALAILISFLAYLLFAHAVSARVLMGQLNLILSTNQSLRKELLVLQSKQRDIQQAYREEKIRAQEANRSKAAFLAHLSHDIRTPLNHIIGFADLIGHQTYGPVGDKRYLTYIQSIKQSGEDLLLSVADVLELAQLESGQRILSAEEILVDDLLTGLRKRFEPRAARCGVILDVDCFCASVLIGDRMGFERMLENVLDNAVRFTPAGGKIRLSAWVADDSVVLEVTDTGIGISPDRMSKLLTPFTLTDASKRKEHGGLGLGLAISQALAELSGGEIAIDSTPAIGTTVAISLPFNASKISQNTIAA